jgi:hypothetical protein
MRHNLFTHKNHERTMTVTTKTKTKTEAPSFTVDEAPTGNPLAGVDDHGSCQEPALPRGRMIFALDATGSRAATWAIACKVQAEMFRAAAPIGKLDVQLVYYRGAGERPDESQGQHRQYRQCRASKWKSSGEEIAQVMNQIECWGGATQIGRVLTHALSETEKAPVQALVFIGDAMEGDHVDELARLAGELGARGVPIFVYQEGRDPVVRKAFRLLALKSGGEYFELNPETEGAVEQLTEQLGAVARLAMGDTEALDRLDSAGTVALTDQRRHDRGR